MTGRSTKTWATAARTSLTIIALAISPSILAHEGQASEALWSQVIPHFEVKNVTIVEALAALKPYGIQVGLELKPIRWREKHASFSLVLNSKPIPEIINAIVASADGYTWRPVERVYPPRLIHVFPKEPNLRFDETMELRIERFEIQGDVDPANAINQIRTRIPALKRGQGTFGSDVHIPGGEFFLTLEDKTLREILNEIALRKSGLCWLFQPIRDETAPQGVSFMWRAF